MVIYQIYPRSFNDADGDGVGDINGITAKIDYLKSLGVEMIWISPFVKSPMRDFGYDVSDYCAIDPLFGTLEDFDRLMQACEKAGLHVMMDMVLSHSSEQHPWFLESRSSRDNPKSGWYVWADGPQPPNNWQSLFGGSAWEWGPERQQFYLHNFLREQPDFNFHEPQVRKALLEICEFWLKKGVRGFRLDVCNFYFQSKGLEDNPLRPRDACKTDGVHADNPYNRQLHVYDKDQPENLEFLAELRALVDRYPGTKLMGEVVSDHSLKIMADYISAGQPLHTAYCFSLFTEGFDAVKVAAVLREAEERLATGQPSWALGNHDVPRFISRFGANADWLKAAKCFLFFLFTLRGNIILFQGEELGLDEVEIPRELMQDPFGIAFYPEFKGRDGCRTPIPWQSVRPTSKTWLPIPENHLQRSVEFEDRDPDSVLCFTRRLVAWRKENLWLETSPLKILWAGGSALVLQRSITATQTFTAAINGGPHPQRIDCPELGEAFSLGAYQYRTWTTDHGGRAKKVVF